MTDMTRTGRQTEPCGGGDLDTVGSVGSVGSVAVDDRGRAKYDGCIPRVIKCSSNILGLLYLRLDVVVVVIVMFTIIVVVVEVPRPNGIAARVLLDGGQVSMDAEVDAGHDLRWREEDDIRSCVCGYQRREVTWYCHGKHATCLRVARPNKVVPAGEVSTVTLPSRGVVDVDDLRHDATGSVDEGGERDRDFFSRQSNDAHPPGPSGRCRPP